MADIKVEIRPAEIRATPRGELFLRNLAMCFDRRLPDAAARGARFSRTV